MYKRKFKLMDNVKDYENNELWFIKKTCPKIRKPLLGY